MALSSNELRENGNKILVSITDFTAPIIKEKRLQEANNYYQKALDTSTNNKEISSALKNLSTTSYKLFKFYAYEKNNDSLTHFYMRIFHDYVNKAMVNGQTEQSFAWFENLYKTSSHALSDYIDYIENELYKKRIDYLYKLLEKSSDHSKCIINYHISKYIFEYSVTLIESKELKKAMTTLRDFNYHYEECKRTLKFLKDDDDYLFSIDSEELDILHEDFMIQKCVADGLYSKTVAKDLLNKCVADEEELNMDLVYDIIDWYHDSIIKTHGRDIECEAEVSSDLGFIYDELLMQKDRAKQHYKNAWQLAESLKPKVFTRFKWFMRCSKAIQRYQKEESEKEQSVLDEEKEKVMPLIKDDLEKIEKKSKNGYYDFLPFIYKEYPPKDQKQKLVEKLNSTNITKALKDAIIHYHPDKNSKEKYGNSWHFISEHITKHLNQYYNNLKLGTSKGDSEKKESSEEKCEEEDSQEDVEMDEGDEGEDKEEDSQEDVEMDEGDEEEDEEEDSQEDDDDEGDEEEDEEEDSEEDDDESDEGEDEEEDSEEDDDEGDEGEDEEEDEEN